MPLQFVWVWRHYMLEGTRFVVVRNMPDVVHLHEVHQENDQVMWHQGPDIKMDKVSFMAKATLVPGRVQS